MRSTDAPLTELAHRVYRSAAAATANPALPGPGIAPGNPERTAPQSDPGSVGGGTIARPERLLVVARFVPAAPGAAVEGDEPLEGEPRYLFARWADWPHPAMLSLAPPALDESLADAVSRVLWARLGVRTLDAARAAETCVPARMSHPRTGVDGLGWLRAVAVTAGGEPAPDALLAGFALLTAPEADAALSTDVERRVFATGVARFD